MTVDLARLVALAETGAACTPEGALSGRQRSWYRIDNRTPDRAEVYLYGDIGMWGVTAKDFIAEIRQVKAEHLELHINSGGGSVFEGVAIYNALLNHPAHIVSIVDALAASAASFIAMAGEEIEVEKTARMMIHDASGGVLGTAKEMREQADLLDGLSAMIAEIYSDRAGNTVKHWRDLMLAETWFTAEQAVDAKLANRIAGDIPSDPSDKILPVTPENVWPPAWLQTGDVNTLKEALGA